MFDKDGDVAVNAPVLNHDDVLAAAPTGDEWGGNHNSEGGNALYVDGHVDFVESNNESLTNIFTSYSFPSNITTQIIVNRYVKP